MSVEDGTTAQSSRILYRTPGTNITKDHKDIYYKDITLGGYEGFHYAMYMKYKDPSVHDVLWRKMFRDRYFTYVSHGSYEWSGAYSLVYPLQKVKSNSINVGYQGYHVHTEKYVIYQVDSIIYVAAEDGRVFIKLKNFDFTYRRNTSEIGVPYLQHIMCGYKDGFIWEERENITSSTVLYNYYYVKLDDNFTVESKEEIFSRNSSIQKFIGDPRSNFVLYRSAANQWGFINTATKEVFSEFGVVSGGGVPVYIMGYWYLTGWYAPDSHQPYDHSPAIQRIGENGVQAFKFLGDYIGRDYSWPSCVIYNSGNFYWYMQPESNTALMLFTASDISGDWTQISLPNTITFDCITSDRTFTFRLKPSYVGVYDADFIMSYNLFNVGTGQVIYQYEDNKRVFDTDWLVADVYRYAPNSNNLLCHFDNLLFEPSENNRYCYNSDTVKYGNMWDHYYTEEGD